MDELVFDLQEMSQPFFQNIQYFRSKCPHIHGSRDIAVQIPKVRFHGLRHTFATIALQNGVDIKTVSSMLGHFSAGFTLDTYAHVTASAQKEAAQTMATALSC